MPATATLFLNRNSGVRAEAPALLEAARAAGVEVIELGPGVDCVRIVRERAARGTNLFIAAGGDGTVHHLVQAIAQTDLVLGVIPTGTYNHFARDLDIPLDWSEALDVALNGESRQIDAARINDRFFINNVSLGLYPEMVARREERGRDYPRWRARIYAIYRTLRKYPHVTLAVEAEAQQELLRTHVFMVSNNSYDLERFGIEAPRETLTEGKLSVYWLSHRTRWELAKLVGRYMAGRVREIPGFTSFRTTSMRVQSPRGRLKVGIDGELFTLDTPLTLLSVPQSVTVRVPRQK
ncbi:MAG TPA: diacylglycerol kinase family protein [Thermoanaerobaculia bacterium]|nr:diacylglycerol kinase family protein [Thermoanaerobaculia bacterium]